MTATLKLINLQNPSAVSPNIVLNADGSTTIPTQSTTNLAYTGTLTGGTGVINIGSGQVYKDASGNVGIGTTSPAVKLHVVRTDGGTIARLAGASYALRTQSLAGVGASIEATNSTEATYQPLLVGGSQVQFTIAGAERARIDSSGNLLVGTTSAASGAGAIVKNASANRTFTIQNSANTNGDQNLWSIIGANANTNASYHFVCDTGGVNRLYIYGTGNVVNSNNSYGALSDVKLKENITDATPKLADLMQVRIRNYNLKSDPEQKQLGVIAQELEQIFPGMIDESPDRDAKGNDLGTTTKSVKYSVFVPMLVKAIQELKAEFDAYKLSHP